MLTFLKRLAASVPTPATDKVTVFVEDSTGEPSYKDDTGTVTSLKGAAGPAGGFFFLPERAEGRIFAGYPWLLLGFSQG